MIEQRPATSDQGSQECRIIGKRLGRWRQRHASRHQATVAKPGVTPTEQSQMTGGCLDLTQQTVSEVALSD